MATQLKQLILLAEYNQLMNQRQYAAAGKLSDTQLREDKGAFFKSVLGSLNHILVGDIIWLKRFSTHLSSQEVLSDIIIMNKPASLDAILFENFSQLKAEREKIDAIIIKWVNQLVDTDMDECIVYTNMRGQAFSKPFSSLINHLFLHQVHHRGQVSTLLSQFALDFGETDLIEIIDDCKT
ncbi:MAG: damage-inducible protein DinB [Gammaproteobacteria bacterium]|nr:damage-inducible protein DinB [Gammaproteobacteria bacterium]